MTYDYCIVGAGSAGCVMANRLSADPNCRVLLLEAGPRDWNPLIHMPAGLAMLVNQKGVNWNYSTEPEPELENRRLWWPRGKVLGGSSSINAMCYIRGHRLDYQEWVAAGCTGWEWEQLLPLFKQAEGNTRGASEFHGADGLLGVQDLLHTNPLSARLLDAAVEAGHPRNADFNGADPLGVGYYQVTQRNGARCSSASAYLDPARKRANLDIRTAARVQRVLFDGQRATGVELLRKGRIERIEAGEVLLCGGAINSPQLLMLSGIGAASELATHGIRSRVDLPAVGRNLQDHLDACTIWRTREPITYDHTNDLLIGLRYFLFRSGIGTSNIAESGGFARSSLAPDARPDVQFHFVPAILDDHGRNRLPGHGVTIHACGLRPRSRGQIDLGSADPMAAPRIRARYLSDADGYDLKVLIEAVRMSRAIFRAPGLADLMDGEMHPGCGDSDDEIEAFIRRKAETIYHPVGTCRMGSDPQSVVDPQLRVRGVQGLRVIDASIMPTLIGGNTNAPTMVIAERAYQMIKDSVGSTSSEIASAA